MFQMILEQSWCDEGYVNCAVQRGRCSGMTPLHLASNEMDASRKRPGMIRALLQARAAIEAPNED